MHDEAEVGGTGESIDDLGPAEAWAPAAEGVIPAEQPVMPIQAVGVDACQGGWVAVWAADGRLNARVHTSFVELISSYPHVACIAIGVPIGLTAAGARACDKAARALLGAPRDSSVLPAPDPRLLTVDDFGAASARSMALTQKGLSRQLFATFPRVAEVDELMSPLLQTWVVSVHPELSLWAMAGGRATAHAKRDPAGYEERRDLLTAALGIRMPATKLESRDLVPKAAPDEVFDAAAALWTGHRVAGGLAKRLPETPEPEHDVDRRGRRMELVY